MKIPMIAKPRLPVSHDFKEPPEGKTPAYLWGFRACFDKPDLIAPGEGNNTEMAEKANCIAEWDLGIIHGLMARGWAESKNPFAYMHMLKDTNGVGITKNIPVVLHLKSEHRIARHDDAREIVESLTKNGTISGTEQREGFLSIFETEHTPDQNWTAEQIKNWNLGAERAANYARSPNMMSSDLENFRKSNQSKQSMNKEKVMSNEQKAPGEMAEQSTWDRAKEVLKDDGVEVAFRVLSMQINEKTQDLIISQLTKGMSGSKKNKYIEMAKLMFTTPAGKLMIGGTMSQILPQLAKLPHMDKYKEHIERLARECRLEGMTATGNMLANVATGYIGDMATMIKNTMTAVDAIEPQTQARPALGAAPVTHAETVKSTSPVAVPVAS